MSAAPPLVLIPAYNEQECIAGVVREVRAALPDACVLVVDDGSSDGTREAAQRAGAQVLTLPFNLGVGGALRTGFKFALRHGFDVAVQVDGDGQHDPQEVTGLVARLEDADMVIGARFAGRGAYAVRGPRRLAMRLLARALSRVARTPLTDVTSGFRAFGPRAVALLAETLPTEYLGDTVDAIVVASRAGLRVAQHPVAMRERRGGRPSQSPLKATFYLGRSLLALLLSMLRRDERLAAADVDVTPDAPPGSSAARGSGSVEV